MHTRGKVLDHLSFRDHHRYTASDIDQIVNRAKTLAAPEKLVIVTTEKDFVKLSDPLFKDKFDGYSLCYLPVKMVFVNAHEEQLFISKMESSIVKAFPTS